MHALIVVAHPDPKSLSHSVAAQLGEGVSRSGHSIEIADLAAEGFDPRFTVIDLAVHRREVPPPADVAAEQARIDRADALVLVYPVYWVVDARPAEGMDRPCIRQWLGVW